jgi:hypothetical protein
MWSIHCTDVALSISIRYATGLAETDKLELLGAILGALSFDDRHKHLKPPSLPALTAPVEHFRQLRRSGW